MKNQALFSSKVKSKKLKCCLLQFLFGALRARPTLSHLLNNQAQESKHCFLIKLSPLLKWQPDHECVSIHLNVLFPRMPTC